MDKTRKKELVRRGSETKVTVHVGKEGLTEGLVEEIKAQIKRDKLVKVRVLPSAGMEREDVARELEERTGAKCVETRGFTVLLCEARTYAQR